MSIRKKIFLLAGILLALFGVVVGVLAAMQKLDGEQIDNIVNYELPLSRLMSEFDVGTDRYELNIMRMLRIDTRQSGSDGAALSTKQTLTDGLRKDVDAIQLLVQRAIDDPRYHTEDRVNLAHIKGSFKYIIRNLDDFWLSGNKRWAACRRQGRGSQNGLPRICEVLRRPSARIWRKSDAALPA